MSVDSHLETQYAYWTRTGLGVCFPYTSMPAYATLPLLPCLFYLRLSTLGAAIVVMLLIWQMSRRGYTLTWLLYRLRGKLVNNRYTSRPTVYIRRFALRDWNDTPF